MWLKPLSERLLGPRKLEAEQLHLAKSHTRICSLTECWERTLIPEVLQQYHHEEKQASINGRIDLHRHLFLIQGGDMDPV